MNDYACSTDESHRKGSCLDLTTPQTGALYFMCPHERASDTILFLANAAGASAIRAGHSSALTVVARVEAT